MPADRLTVISQPTGAVGAPWRLKLKGVSRYQSLVIEFYGSTGGIYRYFPRGRDEMDFTFYHAAAGKANLVVFGRDFFSGASDAVQCEFEIGPVSSGRAALRDDDDDWHHQLPAITSASALKDDDDDWHHQLPGSASGARSRLGEAIEKSLGRGATVLPQHGKPPIAETERAAVRVEASAAAPQRTRATDPADAMRQKLEARLMKRFDTD